MIMHAVHNHALNPSLRQSALRTLLAQHPSASQEELVQRLREQGLRVTQATLSRDLRTMGALKGPDGYVLPGHSAAPSRGDEQVRRASGEFLLSAKRAGNLVVLRTGPGQASALALVIDRASWPDIVGTVAGDDTVFLAADSPAQAGRLAALFEEMRQ